MSSVGRGLSSTGATEEDPSSAMQPTLSRSLVQVEPPRWFCSTLLLQATRARRAFQSQRGPLLPERESAVPLDLLSFSYSHQRQQNLAQKGEPRGNFLFMPKVDLIEVKWAK